MALVLALMRTNKVGNSSPQTCSSSWQKDIKVNRVHHLEILHDLSYCTELSGVRVSQARLILQVSTICHLHAFITQMHVFSFYFVLLN